MRKNIALVLALVMILSLLPFSASAVSDNRVTSRPSVQEDDFLAPAGWTGDKDILAPNLVIANNKGDLDTGTFIIELSLSNAEWVDEAEDNAYISYFQEGDMDAVEVNKLSDSVLEVVFTGHETGTPELIIPMWTEITSDEGVAEVTIDPLDSPVTGGTYVFAVISDAATSFTAESVIRMGEAGVLDDLRIRELSVGAMGTGTTEVTFELPRDFEWPAALDGADLAANNVSFSAAFQGTTGADVVDIDRDRRRMTVEFNLGDERNARGNITLIDWPVQATRDARFGDVTIDMRGSAVTNQKIKVAEYVDWGIKVEADGDPEEIVAGLLPDLEPNEGELATLVLEETINGSWFSNRRVAIEFPSWVQIVSYDVDSNAHINPGLDEGETVVPAGDWDNKLEFTPEVLDSGRAKLEIDFVVTARANAEGDITATVTSRAFDQDYEVVLGQAIAPVTVEAEVTEVVSGIQRQPLGDIVITENVEGALQEGEDLLINLNMSWSRWLSDMNIEVVEGDLELGTAEVDGNNLTIPVKRSSDEASVIVISEAKVTLDRVPAFGDYNLRVGGSALVNNSGADSNVFPFDSPWVTNAPIIDVVSDVTGTRPEVTTTFTVGLEVEPGTAPYISEGRMMIPVRFLEDVTGVKPIWNESARTVTMLYNGMVYEMAIGSNVLRVNGAPYMEMETAAEITNARTFVPFSRFLRAMGIDYEWDGVTQTVTITN